MSHKEKDQNSLDHTHMRRKWLYLPSSILLHLNTGVACFGTPTHQQQHKHNTMQLPPTLEGQKLHSRIFLGIGWTQLCSQRQYTETSLDSVASSHLQYGFNLQWWKWNFFPIGDNYLSLHSSYYLLASTWKIPLLWTIASFPCRSKMKLWIYMSKHRTYPKTGSFAHFWCNDYPIVAWPYLVFIINHAWPTKQDHSRDSLQSYFPTMQP